MTAEPIDTSDAMDKPSSSVWLSAVMLHLAHVWDDYVYPFGNDFADDWLY